MFPHESGGALCVALADGAYDAGVGLVHLLLALLELLEVDWDEEVASRLYHGLFQARAARGWATLVPLATTTTTFRRRV